MAKKSVKDFERMSLRIRARDKELLMRAAALDQTTRTGLVLRHGLPAAKAVIEDASHDCLSARDTLRVLDLLENPPAPNAKLVAAARALCIGRGRSADEAVGR